MKPSILILSILLAASLIYIFTERSGKQELQDKEVRADQTISRISHERDSLKSVVSAVQDSLRTTFLLLANQKIETEAAHKQTLKEHQKYENIRFKLFANDTARFNAWADIYPSLRNR